MDYGGEMNELPCPSDLTAAQWALIEPLLPAEKPRGRSQHNHECTNFFIGVAKLIPEACQ
jgi:transposase